jgi:hypothetical protein
MRFQSQASYQPQRSYDDRTDRKVGNEVTVHHVDVYPVGPAPLDLGHSFAKSGEIGRQDRWS